jgi:PAS domain S-box-containing protein
LNHDAFGEHALSSQAILAEFGGALLGPLGQACLAGVVLNLTAAIVSWYLWRRDPGERFLAFWAVGYAFTALRWVATYPAVAFDVPLAMALGGVSASLALALNLTGGYTLLGQRRVSQRVFFFGLLTVLVALAIIAVPYRMVAPVLGLASLATLAAAAAIFWRAHDIQPLSAYRIAAGAMLFNFFAWSLGLIFVGRGFVMTIFPPLLTLPTMIAFFVIAYQRALAKARDSEETVNTLFDTVPVPIVISTPPEGRVERINKRALELFGLKADENIGKSGPESGIVADIDKRNQMYRDLADGQDVRNREATYRTSSGKPLQMSVNASRVELRDGIRYVFTLYDLTDIRQVELALQELNATLEQQVADRTRDLESFSYSVSHDLRAPLRAIDSYSAMLAEEAGDALSAPAMGYLARIRESCQRMGQIIDAMSSLARLGAARFEPTLVDISALATEIGRELEAAEPGRRVEMRIEPWMRATADIGAVRVILENLMQNAWKYSSKVALARITVGSETRGAGRVYFVRDNGAGFDMQRAGELFQPFTRLHDAAEFEGSGIGLASVARVIRNLGGRIWAEGEPGAGAVFRFTLGPAEVRQRETGAARMDPGGRKSA